MDSDKVRLPCVAGQFYDAEPERLKKELKRLKFEFSLPGPTMPEELVRAAILPHAGYSFSAPSAVKTLSAASGGAYKRVLIMAPSHRLPFAGMATAGYSAYRTPLGDVPIDMESVRELNLFKSPFLRELPQAHEREHSIEVQLPILQSLLPPAPIVPLVCGQMDSMCAERLAKMLFKLWRKDTLWIVSSDFTHYGRSFGYVPFGGDVEGGVRKLDFGAIDRILSMDSEGFSGYIERTGATICGANPIKVLLAVLALAKDSGETIEGRLADYSNSGQSTGDWDHCVSYAGLLFSERV